MHLIAMLAYNPPISVTYDFNSMLAVAIGITTLMLLTLGVLAYVVARRLGAETARAEALSQSEACFRSLVQNASDVIQIVAADGTVTYTSPSIKQILGYEPEDWLGKKAFELVHPDDLAQVECLLREALLYPATNIAFEFRLRHASGETRDFEAIANNLLAEPSVAGIVTTYRDINKHKKTELALFQRAAELAHLTSVLAQTNAVLKKRNQELDQFAYVVSHDLKAPLRAIANLSEWIEEDLSDTLTEDTQHQMDLLRGRVHRMEALINGLLQYSRVGRFETAKVTVSVASLLAEVIDSLAPPETLTITVEPNMPTLVTHRLPLEQVFTNLISNAIKHHPGKDGKVQISVQDQGLFYEFAVADDGAGIAPQYHEKVFGIFQTLEARDKSENTGIGLAIVKKIVEGQGGSIRLESQEGQGARFSFTWSK
jgi:hypothetical protein